MSALGAVVVYVCAWWVVFLMTLPWGAKPVENPEPGHVPSAPEKPRLLLKAAITTVLAAVVTYGAHRLIESGLIDLRPPP